MNDTTVDPTLQEAIEKFHRASEENTQTQIQLNEKIEHTTQVFKGLGVNRVEVMLGNRIKLFWAPLEGFFTTTVPEDPEVPAVPLRMASVELKGLAVRRFAELLNAARQTVELETKQVKQALDLAPATGETDGRNPAA